MKEHFEDLLSELKQALRDARDSGAAMVTITTEQGEALLGLNAQIESAEQKVASIDKKLNSFEALIDQLAVKTGMVNSYIPVVTERGEG